MGLAARAIEAVGISTVCLAWVPDLAAAAGAPRVAGIAYPGSSPLGAPGDSDGQLAVLRAALAVAAELDHAGRVDLPCRWPGPRSAGMAHPRELPPIAQLLKRKPWLLPRLLRRDVPG